MKADVKANEPKPELVGPKDAKTEAVAAEGKGNAGSAPSEAGAENKEKK